MNACPRYHLKTLALLATLLSSGIAHAGVNADRAAPAQLVQDSDSTDRFIVRFRDRNGDPRPKLTAIGSAFGERLDHVRPMSGDAHVVRLGRRVMRLETRELVRRLATDPRIASIEPDTVMHPLSTPNDTMFGQQWHYHEAAGGINLPRAWDLSTGSSAIRIAIIDTGVLPHAELAGRTIGGFDFIADTAVSNDGDGRDANAADPGDYGCNGAASSWHGTHVAGTIGAASNNGAGVTGINWVSRLVPVRVLGRCGGYTSDIVDGMRWAAGIDVPGVPANPYPARVENISLGASGTCSAAFQSAVNDVVARGTVVVVAAGNNNADAAGAQPASCNGVIAVAATTRNGGRAGYSNFGAKVTIAAPGGGSGDAVLSTLNTGSTTPAADSFAWFQGTSMATPHVSGVVSLMLSLDPSLTPAQVAQRLRAAARPFPTGTGNDCNTSLCGAGIVDAAASLAGLAAPTPAPSPAPAPTPPTPNGWTRIAEEGQPFSLNGTQTVRYGSEPYWIMRTITGGGACTNEFFQTDPAYGIRKGCEVSTTVASPVPPPAISGWTKIANEWEGFSVSGTQTVRYGSGSAWISQSVTGVGSCTNSFFGRDPANGIVKECQVATAPAWTRIAGEWEAFSVSGTQTVRYGSGATWITKSVTGNGACTNAFFGNDPLPGTVKQCEVAAALTSTVARR